MNIKELTSTGGIAVFNKDMGLLRPVNISTEQYKEDPFYKQWSQEDELDESKTHKFDLSDKKLKESDLDDVKKGDEVLLNKKPVKVEKMIFNYNKNIVTFQLKDSKDIIVKFV